MLARGQFGRHYSQDTLPFAVSGIHGIRTLLFNTVPTVYHSLPSYTHPIAAVVRAIARSLSQLVSTTSKVVAAAWP